MTTLIVLYFAGAVVWMAAWAIWETAKFRIEGTAFVMIAFTSIWPLMLAVVIFDHLNRRHHARRRAR